MITETELKAIETLNKRSYSIFCQLGEGKSREEIANTTGFICSPKTIDTYFCILKDKLSCEDIFKVRALATRYLCFIETHKIVRLETAKHFMHQRIEAQ